MKNLFKFMFPVVALVLGACSENEGVDPDNGATEEAKVVLVPSTEEVVVGEDSYVDFTVKFGKKDVTSEAKIYFEPKDKDEKSQLLKEPRFLIEERTSHTFYAIYDGKISEKIVVVGDLNLVLTPDSSPVLVDANTAVNFTVSASGEDVTSKAKIFHRMASEAPEAAEWIPAEYYMTELGEHIFYCVYNDIASDEILVYGVEELIEKVDDSNPDQYEAFLRRVMGIQGTSTECSWCPHMIKAIDDTREENGKIEKGMIFVAAHGTLGAHTDPMQCPASDNVLNMTGMNAIGYPGLSMSLSNGLGFTLTIPLKPSDNDGKVDVLKEQLVNTYSAIMEYDAKSAISASSILKKDADKVLVRADVKVATDASLSIAAWLIEDGIESEQVNADKFPDHDFSIHNGALCATYPRPESKQLYTYLGAVERQAAGEEYSFYCEFDLKQFETIQNIDNCRVVIFTYDNDSVIIDNAIEFPVGGSKAIDYVVE